MTWTKLDDQWSEQEAMKDLDYETRWHLLTLVQMCSRSGRFDGFIRRGDALRCSDVPDPAHCLAELVTSPFLDIADGGYQLTRDDYFPPQYLRDGTAKPRSKASSRSYRERKARCDAGDHSESCPKACPERDPSRDQSPPSSPLDGTGRASTQETHAVEHEDESTVTHLSSWPDVVKPGSAKTCTNCGRVSAWVDGGYCRRDQCQAARKSHGALLARGRRGA